MAKNTHGRKKGSKNLKHEDGLYVNQFNVKFTDQEKKKLESLVNSANRKRKRMLEMESKLPLFIAGQNTGQTIGETTGLMGKESDFILAKKTKSLQRFRNHNDYERYIKNLEKVVDREYINKRAEQYKENHILALKNVFGHDAKEAIETIQAMSTKKYMEWVQSDETLEIGFPYGPEEYNAKLEQLEAVIDVINNPEEYT
jgi:hypothetical protein